MIEGKLKRKVYQTVVRPALTNGFDIMMGGGKTKGGDRDEDVDIFTRRNEDGRDWKRRNGLIRGTAKFKQFGDEV